MTSRSFWSCQTNKSNPRHASLALFDRFCIHRLCITGKMSDEQCWFFNFYTLNKEFHWNWTLLRHQPSVLSALESLDLIKSFTNPLYFDVTSISVKSVERTQKCYFCYYKCLEQLTFKEMKWFWKLIPFSIRSPNMGRFVEKIFFLCRQVRLTGGQSHENLL